VQTGPTGVQETTYFDGAGRVVSRHMLDIDASQQDYEVYRARYNEAGEILSETMQDWATNTTADIRSSSLTADAVYGVWGDVNALHTSDGLTTRNDFDPVGLTQRQHIQGVRPGRRDAAALCSGVVNHIFDPASLLLVRSEQHDTAGNIQGVAQYGMDGRGLLRRYEDERGHVTAFTYDPRGRELTRTLPDGSVVCRRYAPHLAGEQIVALSVTGPDAEGTIRSWVAGTQAFDSLGRLTESVSGGRTTRYVYEGASPQPADITLPSGESLHYTYIPELGNAVSSLTAGELSQTFVYDTLSGALLQAEEGNVRNSNTWTLSGMLQKEVTSRDNAARHALHAYTLTGTPLTYTDVTGQETTYRYDIDGRLTDIIDNALTVNLTYDALGRLATRTVTDTAMAGSLTLTLQYDDFSREILRTIMDSDGTILTLEQTWLPNNLLARRLTRRDSMVLKDEQYDYDSRNRLTDYTVSGSEPPQDAYGHLLAGQQYRHDALNNLTTVITLLTDGNQDTAVYHYDNLADPMQLSRVTHTHDGYPPSIALEYDAEGRMTLDEEGRTLGYDGAGRLNSISGEDVPWGTYGYDAFDRLVRQTIGPDDSMELYYRGEERVNEVRRQSEQEIRLIKMGHSCIGVSDARHLTLTAGDGNESLLWSRSAGQTGGGSHHWSPYGQGQPTDLLPGFNGERADPISGSYHLGNGYRAYNPTLMRFTCPDSLSPFGAGGINPYAYCLGDPVNRIDPTGHISWQGILGIVTGILGIGLSLFTAGASIAAAGGIGAALGSASKIALLVGVAGVAADITGIVSGVLEDVNPQASSVLGWVTMATGIAGFAGGSALLPGGVKAAREASRARRRGNQITGRATYISDSPDQQNRIGQLYRDLSHWQDIHMVKGADLQKRIGRTEVFEVTLSTELATRQYLLRNIGNNSVSIPDGGYIFVNPSDAPGQIFAMRYSDNNHIRYVGHTSLTQKNGQALPVRYAGSLEFEQGKLVSWDNASGHYRPSGSLHYDNLIPWTRRLLPQNKFMDYFNNA